MHTQAKQSNAKANDIRCPSKSFSCVALIVLIAIAAPLLFTIIAGGLCTQIATVRRIAFAKRKI